MKTLPNPQLNADLHCHSVVSDGTLTPEVLAPRAKANGVELWALTDHDEIGGQDRALAAAKALSLPYLTGTEISVTFANKTVHIVGLGFDHHNTALAQGLRQARGGREERAREMSEGLAKVGIPGAFEGALRFAGNPELISRTHFARFLVGSGVCNATPQVFCRFLPAPPLPVSWGRPAFATTPPKFFAAFSPNTNPDLCRTAGPTCATPCSGSPVPKAWP